MERRPYYPILESEIAKRGIKKKDIASALQISQRSFSQKINGKLHFWYDEACLIQKTFFKDVTKDSLFSHETDSESKETKTA